MTPTSIEPVAEHVDTVIVGGGQAGLATGYHLAQRGLPFVILDANERPGDSWRRRWDSLRLFTPARYSGLPGLPYPGPRWSFPTKDGMADYLEDYAAHFELAVHGGRRVDRLSRSGERFRLVSGGRRFEADNVVVATGAYQVLRVPGFAAELDPAIVQLDATEYRNPSQLRDGSVLVVGAGNSGAEIALEVAADRPTFLSGPSTGHVPIRTGGVWDRVLTPPFWFVASHVLTTRTPIGKKLRPKVARTAAPLERARPKELGGAGVERVPRTVGVRDGYPELEDGRVLEVANVIWCPGYRADFGWIELPILGEDGEPKHTRGVVAGEPGLYFVGRPFLYAFTSSLIGGVGRDAEYVVEHLTQHRRVRGASLDAHVPAEERIRAA
jgi:putative flavoprotein involved in K+ transport